MVTRRAALERARGRRDRGDLRYRVVGENDKCVFEHGAAVDGRHRHILGLIFGQWQRAEARGLDLDLAAVRSHRNDRGETNHGVRGGEADAEVGGHRTEVLTEDVDDLATGGAARIGRQAVDLGAAARQQDKCVRQGGGLLGAGAGVGDHPDIGGLLNGVVGAREGRGHDRDRPVLIERNALDHTGDDRLVGHTVEVEEHLDRRLDPLPGDLGLVAAGVCAAPRVDAVQLQPVGGRGRPVLDGYLFDHIVDANLDEVGPRGVVGLVGCDDGEVGGCVPAFGENGHVLFEHQITLRDQASGESEEGPRAGGQEFHGSSIGSRRSVFCDLRIDLNHGPNQGCRAAGTQRRNSPGSRDHGRHRVGGGAAPRASDHDDQRQEGDERCKSLHGFRPPLTGRCSRN